MQAAFDMWLVAFLAARNERSGWKSEGRYLPLPISNDYESIIGDKYYVTLDGPLAAGRRPGCNVLFGGRGLPRRLMSPDSCELSSTRAAGHTSIYVRCFLNSRSTNERIVRIP